MVYPVSYTKWADYGHATNCWLAGDLAAKHHPTPCPVGNGVPSAGFICQLGDVQPHSLWRCLGDAELMDVSPGVVGLGGFRGVGSVNLMVI